MKFGTQIKQSLDGWRLIGTPFIFGLLLLLTPILLLVLLSFWTQEYLDLNRTFTLANYREIFSHPVFITLIKRSVNISLFVTASTVLLAFPVAYYISFYGGKRKALLLFLITIPFWTSYLLRIFLWKIILGYNGVINSGLISLNFIQEPLTFILYNSNAVVLALAHAWAPFAIFPIYVSLEKIDRSLLEAGRDLGDTAVRSFFRITLPLAMPGIIAASLIVFIPTIGDYVTPKLVGGTEGMMVANMIQVQFSKANNAPLAAALAIVSLSIVVLISLVFLFFNRKYLRRQI